MKIERKNNINFGRIGEENEKLNNIELSSYSDIDMGKRYTHTRRYTSN